MIYHFTAANDKEMKKNELQFFSAWTTLQSYGLSHHWGTWEDFLEYIYQNVWNFLYDAAYLRLNHLITRVPKLKLISRGCPKGSSYILMLDTKLKSFALLRVWTYASLEWWDNWIVNVKPFDVIVGSSAISATLLKKTTLSVSKTVLPSLT